MQLTACFITCVHSLARRSSNLKMCEGIFNISFRMLHTAPHRKKKRKRNNLQFFLLYPSKNRLITFSFFFFFNMLTCFLCIIRKMFNNLYGLIQLSRRQSVCMCNRMVTSSLAILSYRQCKRGNSSILIGENLPVLIRVLMTL